MYETPKLNRAGNVEKVVRGGDGTGFDLDGATIIPDFIYEEDAPATE